MPPSIKQPHCGTSPPLSPLEVSEPLLDAGENDQGEETPAALSIPGGLSGTQASRHDNLVFSWNSNGNDYPDIPRDSLESSGSLSVQAGSFRSDSLIGPDQDGSVVSNHGNLVPHLSGNGPQVPPVAPPSDATDFNYIGTSDGLMATVFITDAEIEEDFEGLPRS